MKNFLLLILLHACLSSLIACSAGGDSTSESAGQTETAGAAKSCLLAYRDKLDGLLSAEEAAAVAEKPKEQVRQKYNRVMKNASYHSVQYVWKSGRTREMEVMGKPMTLPVSDLVELHGLKEVKLDYFLKSHRAPTEAQVAGYQKEIDKALDGKSNNAEVNEKLKKLDEMKVSKETQKEAAGALTSTFAKVAKSYSEVSGIGQAAAWNAFENRLYVFDNGVELAITVDVSNEGSVNRTKAVDLAKKLINCQ